MEGEAAGDQQSRVDRGQQHLQFVDAPSWQGVHGPEGEIGRKQTGEGHAIGDQEQPESKQAEITVFFVLDDGLLLAVGGCRKRGAHRVSSAMP